MDAIKYGQYGEQVALIMSGDGVVVNHDQLDQLNQLEDGFAKEMIVLFNQQMEEGTKAIRKLAYKVDPSAYPTIRQHAHRLSGSSAYLGFQLMYLILKGLEEAADEKDTEKTAYFIRLIDTGNIKTQECLANRQ